MGHFTQEVKARPSFQVTIDGFIGGGKCILSVLPVTSREFLCFLYFVCNVILISH